MASTMKLVVLLVLLLSVALEAEAAPKNSNLRKNSMEPRVG